MGNLFFLVVGIIIVVVSILKQQKRRQVLEDAHRRLALEQPDTGEEGEDVEAGTSEGGETQLQDVLGEILRQVSSAPQSRAAETRQQSGTGAEAGEALADAGARQPAAGSARAMMRRSAPDSTRWTPREARYRKPLIAEDRSGAEDAAGREKRAPGFRPPLIREDRTGGEHAGARRPGEAAWKSPVILETPAARRPAAVSTGAPAQQARPSFAGRFMRAGREQVRDGIVWAEILGKPLALRDE